MECLRGNPAIARSITAAPTKIIKAFHRLVFGDDGDRKNRDRLRNFEGFTFHDGGGAYHDKITFIQEKFKEGELIAICNILGLDYEGSKQGLAKRICNGLMNLNTLLKDNDDSDSEDDDVADNTAREAVNIDSEEDVKSLAECRNELPIPRREFSPPRQPERSAARHHEFSITFRDVEDSIRTFDGSSVYPVDRWIADFEDTSALFNWNEMQKLIFAKRSLKGLAKLFSQSEGVVKDWKTLKDLLKDEFSVRFDSALLHQMLSERKMKKDEKLQEYYLVMKEIAARGTIEEEALIRYVIRGIPDEERDKAILYGAKKLRDFKERLQAYEEIRGASQAQASKNSRWKPTSIKGSTLERESSKKSSVRCYSCGGVGHPSSECKSRSLGPKCFKCNQFGHKSPNCRASTAGKQRYDDKKEATVNNVGISLNEGVCKEVVIRDLKIRAFLDTGSRVTFIRERIYHELQSPTLSKDQISLFGLGQTEVSPLGYFQTVINVDGEEFPATIYVIPNSATKLDMIIGRDVLLQANVTIVQGEVTVKKDKQPIFLADIDVLDQPPLNIGEHASKDAKDVIERMMTNYIPNKCKTTNVEMNIVLKNEESIYQRPRRLPPVERVIVEKQVHDWLEDGIIEPCSFEYASPVVVVKKKDGSPRVCIDYRKLNRVVVKDRYPLPLIEDQLDKLQDAKVFSTMDLKNGFFHVKVTTSSRKYTSFVTHCGQYQFLKVPFGLCNSPSVFQRFVNCVFSEEIKEGIVIPYLDDLIITAPDINKNVERLKKVLKTASDYGLEINFKKCQFLQERVAFLGYIIENGALYPSPDKSRAVALFPEPRSLKSVQSFLGLTGYFHALAKEPVLKIYHPSRETELHTDASQDGYGAVLLQKSPTRIEDSDEDEEINRYQSSTIPNDRKRKQEMKKRKGKKLKKEKKSKKKKKRRNAKRKRKRKRKNQKVALIVNLKNQNEKKRMESMTERRLRKDRVQMKVETK